MLPKVRVVAVGGGILALAGVGAIVGWNRPQWPERTEEYGRHIPRSGLVLNPEGRSNPGEPLEAERDLKEVYRGLVAYIERNGKFPMPGELAGSDEKPGLLARDLFKLPDIDFSDYGSSKEPNATYAFAYRAPRFDMTPKPVRPAAGERDVWMYTDAYVRRNTTVFRDGTRTMDPQGAYVVLWSDGQIERIHPLDVVWTGPDHDRIMRFPGEPGTETSAKNAVTERNRLLESDGIRLVGSE